MKNPYVLSECFKVSRDCFGSKNNRVFKKIRNAGFTSESDNDLGKLWYQICDSVIKSSAIEHYTNDIFYISKNLKVKTKLDRKAENSIVSMELAIKSFNDLHKLADAMLFIAFDQQQQVPDFDFRDMTKSYCLDIPVSYKEKEYHFSVKFTSNRLTSGRLNKRSVALFMRLDGLPLTDKQIAETVFGGTYVGQ